jgi:hypothetical protein
MADHTAPAGPSSVDATTQHPDDPEQVHVAQVLAFDYVLSRLEAADYDWVDCPQLPPPDRVRLAMRTMGESFEMTYARILDSMIAQLHIDHTTVYPAFVALSKELFRDAVNWGRIVALFAFGGKLAVHCARNGMPTQHARTTHTHIAGMSERVINIAQWVQIFVSTELRPWIDANGGWVSVRVFSVVYAHALVSIPISC